MKESEEKKTSVQLHVQVKKTQVKRFKDAIGRLGYYNMSSFFREKIRQAIKDAEKIEGGVS